MRVISHIDDPMVCGTATQLDTFWTTLSSHVVLKRGGRIDGTTLTKYLGRVFQTVNDSGYRGFRVRMPESFFKALGEDAGLTIGISKTSVTPTVASKEADSQELSDITTPLDNAEHSAYRGIVGKLQWVKHERPEIRYAVKCVSHALATPHVSDMKAAKRIVRYLLGCWNVWMHLVLPDITTAELKAQTTQLIG